MSRLYLRWIDTWIGRQRPIAIGPIYKALDTPKLAESSVSVTSLRDKDQWGLLYCWHYRISCSPTWAECTSWAVYFNIHAMSCVQAVKPDLLVVYTVINLRCLDWTQGGGVDQSHQTLVSFTDWTVPTTSNRIPRYYLSSQVLGWVVPCFHHCREWGEGVTGLSIPGKWWHKSRPHLLTGQPTTINSITQRSGYLPNIAVNSVEFITIYRTYRWSLLAIFREI